MPGPRSTRKGQNGFSLLELLLALVIVGVIAAFTVTLSNSVRHSGKAGDTRQRMEVIAAKMREYYRHQGNLPTPINPATGAAFAPLNVTTTYTGWVPVTALNLETKYAMDGWGQRLQYAIRIGSVAGSSNIKGLTVDSITNMAGVLLSGGGNETVPVATWGNAAATTSATSTGDDIVLAVNVNQEATEIALEEVRELQKRVQAFDTLYSGYDNGGTTAVDESGCVAATAASPCPPLSGLTNDPNCGSATLDSIQTSAANYTCSTTALSGRAAGFITDARTFTIAYYALSDNYLLDPWGNAYVWGLPATYPTTDPRYRKFFSSGPNGAADPVAAIIDDIIP